MEILRVSGIMFFDIVPAPVLEKGIYGKSKPIEITILTIASHNLLERYNHRLITGRHIEQLLIYYIIRNDK